MINIYCLEINDPRLAQVEFRDTVFHELVLKNPSEILEHRKTFSSIKLEAHDKFNSQQEWFLTRKTMDRPGRSYG